jgi:transcription termination/antitermination protein NusG
MIKTINDMDTKWYVIRAVAGKEKKAKEQLEFEIKNLGFDDKVKQLLIPVEKVYHVRNGKKVASERNHYPGYILIEADPSIIGEISGLNKIVNFVVGFLGDKKPQPLRELEVNRILGKIDELATADDILICNYSIGESVNIIDGPFSNFNGTVTEIFEEKKRIKLDVKIFGRSTPLELNFEQVLKQD